MCNANECSKNNIINKHLEQTHWHPKPMWQHEHFNHYGTFMTTGDSQPYALFAVSCGSLQTGRCQVNRLRGRVAKGVGHLDHV